MSKQQKIRVALLEYHVTKSCNLTCASCNHYTHILKGHNKNPEELDFDLTNWAPRLDVGTFHLMGGEPFVHKQLLAFCEVARKHLATTKIFIYTNGLLIDRVPDLDFLGSRLSELNVGIKLTVHSQNAAYQQQIQKVYEILRDWKTNYGLSFVIRDQTNNWTRRYFEDADGVISPFDDRRPKQSWNCCICRTSRQLVDGKIYKCPQIAYLQYMKKMNKTSPAFDPYLSYKPISYNATYSELEKFFHAASNPESVCGMCPATPEPITDDEKNSKTRFK